MELIDLLQERRHFFLNRDQGFRALGALGRLGELAFQLGDTLYTGVGGRGGGTAATLPCADDEFTATLCRAPRSEVRRVQALAPEQGPELAGLRAARGLFEQPALVAGGELAAVAGRR